MEQVKTADKAQNRLARELDTRAEMQRPPSVAGSRNPTVT